LFAQWLTFVPLVFWIMKLVIVYLTLGFTKPTLYYMPNDTVAQTALSRFRSV
jgi:hypothetical protein